MAIARVECTCKTCGNTFEVKATRANSTQAREFEEWAVNHCTECSECSAKRKEEQDRQRYAGIDMSDYSPLRGSEKQIAWANDIRRSFIAQEIDPWLGKSTLSPVLPKGPIDYADLRAYAVQIADAKWWIDSQGDIEGTRFERKLLGINNRWSESSEKVENIMRTLLKAWRRTLMAQQSAQVDSAPAEQQPAAPDIPVTAPENVTHTGAVEISVCDSEVSASYGRNDDYITVVKELGYKYDGARKRWYKAIGVTNGPASDRAAELGSRMLNAGFAVRIEDPAIREAAIRGDYAPETTRWIDVVRADDARYAGWLAISWGRSDDLYSKARALRRSRYDHGRVVVPATEWQDVMDFAHIYDFRVTPAAEAAVEAQQRNVEVVDPAPVRKAEYAEKPIKDILNSSRDVLPDLRDEL